jgi:hypothetical protein
MSFALEAFGIDLVDILGAGGAGGKPAVVGDDFEAADRGAVAGGLGEFGGDAVACEGSGFDIGGSEFAEAGFLLWGSGGINAVVIGCAQFGGLALGNVHLDLCQYEP